jgi:phage gp29-like protein
MSPEMRLQLEMEDDLDRVEAMGLGDWEEMVDPILKPVRDAVNAVSTYDEFLARLPDIFSKMDAGKLIATLGAAMAIARGLGDARQPA